MIQKGKVSTILNGGKSVTITPYNGGIVSAPITVPYFLLGSLQVNTPVVYVDFEDNTGIVLSRMDVGWDNSVIGESSVRTCTTLTRYRSTVTVHCHGLISDNAYRLCLYTASRHRGNKMGAWYHPDNYDAVLETGAYDHRMGYGKLAGKQISVSSAEVFPAVPDWMPNDGYLQTEWEVGADGTVTIDLMRWLLPMVKPVWKSAWTTQTLLSEVYVAGRMLGVSNNRFAGSIFRFCLVDGVGTAYPCDDTLVVGGGRWEDENGIVLPRIFVNNTDPSSPHIDSSYFYSSIR